MFEFKILARDKKARAGEFKTPHGKLLTPELAFVATEGKIKSIPNEILPKLPVNLIIVNTFHLWVKKILDNFEVRNPKSETNPNNKNAKSLKKLDLKNSKIASNFDIRISDLQNIHDYSNFQKPIMSDSGGFQVFSLGFGKLHGVGKMTNIFPLSVRHPERNERSEWSEGSHYDLNNLVKITNKGVEFIFNDRKLLLTPKKSIQLQQKIGADIIFAFDECTSPLNSYEYTKKAMERTHKWLLRCLKQLDYQNQKPEDTFFELLKSPKSLEGKFFKAKKTVSRVLKSSPALFGIVQGGYFEDLRKASAKFVGKQNVAGFGIGGTLGRSKKDMHNILEWTIPLLPDEKPRHLLGIGQVIDIFESVERGVDLFDCVIPTREARHKVLYTKKGKINLRKMKNVAEVIDKDCRCQVCSNNITMQQLFQLFSLRDPRAFFFSTIHNIQFYSDLMKKIRESIQINRFAQLKEDLLKYY